MNFRSGNATNNFRGLYPTTPQQDTPRPPASAPSPSDTVRRPRTPPQLTGSPIRGLMGAVGLTYSVPATTPSIPARPTTTPSVPERPAAASSNNLNSIASLRRPNLSNLPDSQDNVHSANDNSSSSSSNVHAAQRTLQATRDNVPNVIRLSKYCQTAPAMQWWLMFAQWMAFYHLSDAAALSAFPFYLEEIPLQWYMQLEETVKTNLQNLKQAFLKRFAAKKNNFDVNLLHVQQQIGESVEKYLARVYQLTNEYEIPNHLLIGITIQGFNSEIRKIVMPLKPESFEQLRETAMVAERTIKSTGSISDSLTTSLSNLEERLMSNLSEKFEASFTEET